jgi:type II secretory pathway pseudopilin PulG
VRTRFTSIELAVAFAVIGTALAATVPACFRAVRVARTAEATQNVEAIFVATSAVASDPNVHLVSAPLTPPAVPRGATAIDPPGAWDHPTWKALGISYDEPHWYSYRVDIDPDPSTAFRVVAMGDLDGDGVLSTFERSAAREGGAIVPRPGMIVTADLE